MPEDHPPLTLGTNRSSLWFEDLITRKDALLRAPVHLTSQYGQRLKYFIYLHIDIYVQHPAFIRITAAFKELLGSFIVHNETGEVITAIWKTILTCPHVCFYGTRSAWVRAFEAAERRVSSIGKADPSIPKPSNCGSTRKKELTRRSGTSISVNFQRR